MAKGRVAVVSVHPLFGRGIARLLGTGRGLEVWCLEAGLTATAETLRQLKPDAVILEEPEHSSSRADLMRDLPPALLIVVRPQDNIMDVFHQWQVRGACPEDLVGAIRVAMRERRPRVRGSAAPDIRTERG